MTARWWTRCASASSSSKTAGSPATSAAATMTVLIGMFLLGLFIALGSWTVSWSNHVKKQLVVKVYFSPNATTVQKDNVAKMLEQNKYVATGGIHYISK